MGAIMDLACFKGLMLRTCGLHFEKEREQALIKALRQRMSSQGVDASEKYHARLLCDPAELLQLVELLTVNETYFFREPDHLRLMADKLVPELLAKPRIGPVRILSAGCSTGEEPYSIAMMIRERYGDKSDRQFAITGVDIDSSVIAAAKRGVYGKGSFRGMDKTVLERYFEPYGTVEFRVREMVRRQVAFEIVNLLGDTYPSGMLQPDIIFYRNVSIYFPGPVQREIFGRLAGLLAEGGSLLVGATETIHHDIGILSLVEQDSLFFYRKTPAPAGNMRRMPARHSVLPEQVRAGANQNIPVHAARPQTGLKQPPVVHTREHHRKQHHASRRQDIGERFEAALELAHNKQTDKALGILETIVEQDESFSKAYALKGSLLLSASRFEEAGGVCDILISCDPLCLEGYLMLGVIARHKGNNDDALKRFREAIYLHASCWLAHFYTAEILFTQKDGKRARNSYETVIRILEQGTFTEPGQAIFPLTFNAEQFIVICRHKVSQLVPAK